MAVKEKEQKERDKGETSGGIERERKAKEWKANLTRTGISLYKILEQYKQINNKLIDKIYAFSQEKLIKLV